MSLSIVYTRAQLGINAPQVTVETHISNGLPSLSIVGLPETAVKESKERVRSALINSGFEFPTRRVTINLAPADLPKQGGRYDLAIALSILVASGQMPEDVCEEYELIGELALTGDIRSVPGALPTAIACTTNGSKLIAPTANEEELALTDSKQIYIANHLSEVCCHLLKKTPLPSPEMAELTCSLSKASVDMNEVKGQYLARRALEVAAAGRHNLLFYGPPGTGKSMLASRLPTILPTLSDNDAVEVASLYSLSGQKLSRTRFKMPPYRSPHHTASAASLVGGGSSPSPGEISLAHKGVLFLDELPEYGRKVLEVLREPIESGEIHISRAKSSITFPADFQLLGAMNPCPCGYAGHPKIACTDTPQQIAQYRKKLSGPLLDRFDLHVEVAYQSSAVLLANDKTEETSASIYERVKRARQRQFERQGKLNSELNVAELNRYCALSPVLKSKLEKAMDQLALSARGAHRVLKVARTLADLKGESDVALMHLNEALAYRGLEKTSK